MRPRGFPFPILETNPSHNTPYVIFSERVVDRGGYGVCLHQKGLQQVPGLRDLLCCERRSVASLRRPARSGFTYCHFFARGLVLHDFSPVLRERPTSLSGVERVRIVLPAPGLAKKNFTIFCYLSPRSTNSRIEGRMPKRRAPGDTRKAERGKIKELVVLLRKKRTELLNQGRLPQKPETRERNNENTYDSSDGVDVGGCNGICIRQSCCCGARRTRGHHGGHHGHHGHHGGYWVTDPAFFVGGSSVILEDECPTVKRCYINQFGEKRCRWVSECD